MNGHFSLSSHFPSSIGVKLLVIVSNTVTTLLSVSVPDVPYPNLVVTRRFAPRSKAFVTYIRP